MSDYWGYVEIGKDGRVSTHRVAEGNYTRMVVDKLPKDLATVVAALDFLEKDDKLPGGSHWTWYRNGGNPTKCYFICNKDIPERKLE